MNTLRRIAIAVVAFAALATAVPLASSVMATPASEAKDGVTKIGGGTESGGSFGTLVQKIINVMLFVVGALAVIMIVYGGFKYVTSRGEASEVAAAKNTILYAVVGLIVAVMAYAIVNFVLKSFKATPQQDSSQTAPPITNGQPS